MITCEDSSDLSSFLIQQQVGCHRITTPCSTIEIGIARVVYFCFSMFFGSHETSPYFPRLFFRNPPEELVSGYSGTMTLGSTA
jgi:hypothetical protein